MFEIVVEKGSSAGCWSVEVWDGECMVVSFYLLYNFSSVALSNPGLGMGVYIDNRMNEMID